MRTQRPVRRRLMGTLDARMRAPRPARSRSGARNIATGFGLILALGFLLLMLPLSTEEGQWADPVVALFTAVSAICVTGLVVVDTATHWSPLGEVVILALIQVGGLGYMLGTTVILWALGRRLGLRDRRMLRLYYGAPTLGETLSFARGVAIFTFAFEAIGAVILAAAFYLDGTPFWRSLWWGLFHAVSAFNNAGFSVTGSDMTRFVDNPLVLLTITVLAVAGAIGFLPVITLVKRRTLTRLPLDHKLIFFTSTLLLLLGWAWFTAVEWDNDATIGEVHYEDRAVVGLFQSANARTTGYTAVNLGELEDESKLALVGLMFVGGAAGSTAGGLKVGAFSLLFVVMIATIQGREETSIFRRHVPHMVVRQATTLALYFVALVFGFTLALTALSDHPFLDVLFEAVSALCTVGYSAANTATFDTPARFVLMAAMLAGRFSPLMLVLYMTKPRHHIGYRYPEDSVRLG